MLFFFENPIDFSRQKTHFCAAELPTADPPKAQAPCTSFFGGFDVNTKAQTTTETHSENGENNACHAKCHHKGRLWKEIPRNIAGEVYIAELFLTKAFILRFGVACA